MKLLLIILAVFFAVNSMAQKFPEDWIGSYSGDMILGYHNRPNDTIPVDLEIEEVEEDSTWTYRMTYHSDRFGEIVKNYLYVVKSKKDDTHYILDEQNGIKMNQTYMNGSFYGMYDVMGNTYVSTLRRTDEGLYFELIAADLNNKLESASIPEANEDAIEVESPLVTIHQSALLKKQE